MGEKVFCLEVVFGVGLYEDQPYAFEGRGDVFCEYCCFDWILSVRKEAFSFVVGVVINCCTDQNNKCFCFSMCCSSFVFLPRFWVGDVGSAHSKIGAIDTKQFNKEGVMTRNTATGKAM